MNESIAQRALEWVRANGYDSSFSEGESFYAAVETMAEDGDHAAQLWLLAARREAGHRELLKAANADRVFVPTEVGPRSTSARGSMRTRTANGIVRQRELFEVMTVGQYLAWFRQRWREHQRDAGELAAHARVIKLVRNSPRSVPVAEALNNLGCSWEDVMGSSR